MSQEFSPTQADGAARWDCGKLYVERSHRRDAITVARFMRTADRAEVSAVTKQPPISVLVDGIDGSDPCYTIKRASDGKPCGVFGAAESGNPGSGLVWLLGTNDLTTNWRCFLRYSREFLNEMHKHYGFLYNVIDARNKVHIRWLGWMGFTFDKEIPNWGVERRKFILFSKSI